MANHKRGGFLGIGVLLLFIATFVPTPDVSECMTEESLNDVELCIDDKLFQINLIKWANNLGIICCFIGVYRAIGYVDPPLRGRSR